MEDHATRSSGRDNIQSSQIANDVRSTKLKLILSLGISSLVCTCLVVFAPVNGDRRFYSDVLSIISSGVALAFCLQVICRQKLRGVIPRLYGALGTGIALWFIAECIWGYYEIIAGIDTPFPSIADAFWLAGYVPLAYFLVGMLKNLIGLSRAISFPVVGISAFGFLMLGVILQSIYEHADLKSPNGLYQYAVGTAYPIADMFLIVPATAAFIQLRRGVLVSTPWAYLVLAAVLSVIADIGFDYFTSIGGMDNLLWVWNPLYIIAYLAVATSIVWHRSFFTINEGKLLRRWQEQNR